MKKLLKLVICLSLFICLFLVGLPKVNAAYNSKYETETAPANYYAGLNLNQTGESFRRDLGAIISKNFNHHSYSTNNTVLAETDPDPNHNGNIICFYTGQSLSGGWNKEHVWAKSHGFPNSSDYPYCDAHHLRPTLNSINSSRGNSDFGELDGESNVKSDSYGNKWTGSIFEPRDEVKGDVARIMFYMATRYGFESPYNLQLVDDETTEASTGNGRFGGLQTLLKWHYQDPVSTSEIYRNNVIFDNWQHNRNPYIDHPEYVDLAWPNSYSKQEVDQTKVDAVIAKIGALPEVITLNEKELVVAAKAAYDALNYAEKKLVVNESVLMAAVETIQALETPEGPIKPNPIGTESVTVDFANHGLKDVEYTTKYSFTIGGKDFYTSNVGIYGGELRIGSNNKSSSPIQQVDAKYGLDSVTGVVLEQRFDVENSKTLNISVSTKYGITSGWYVLFQKAGSTNYTVVASKTEEDPKSITASLLTPETGHFVVVFVGSNVRMVLSSYQILTAPVGGDLPVYSEYKTYTSAKGTLTDGVLSNAGLRFGGIFEKSLFANATGFGVIVVDAENLGNGTIEEFCEFSTAKELVEFFVDCGCNSTYQDFMDTKAVVDSNGTIAENGDYYQFGYVISDVVGNEKKSVHAVVYVEINNEVHFLEEVVTSYYDTLLAYLISGVLSEEELAVVSSILENL